MRERQESSESQCGWEVAVRGSLGDGGFRLRVEWAGGL